MNVNIHILSVGQKSFYTVNESSHLPNLGFYFFYRPGHYDIIYPEDDKKILLPN